MINAYAAMQAKEKLVPFSYQPNELAATDVEINVTYCGICHSDLSMINNEWGFSQYPLVAGHEVIGTICALGSEVTELSIGQNVGLGWHSGYCHHCDSCHSGDENLCNSSQATIVGRHGGFANKVRAQASAVVPLPEGLDIVSAGPLFCGGITVFNPLIQYNIKPTDKVAVIGIGGLGHLALKFYRAWGCEVTAFTSSDDKREEALQMGAHHTLNSLDSEAIAAHQEKFDFIISTVALSLDWNLYLTTLKAKGRLHFVGLTLEPLDIATMNLLFRQRSISSSPVGSPSTIAKMLEFANQHQIRPEIEVYPMSQVNEALARLNSGKARYRIVLKQN